MFYRKEITSFEGVEYVNWVVGVIVILPTNPTTELNENNRENDHGWQWHDEPPQEYLDWLQQQQQDEGAE